MAFVNGTSFCQDSSRKKSPNCALIVDAVGDTIGIDSGNESSVCIVHDLSDWRSVN